MEYAHQSNHVFFHPRGMDSHMIFTHQAYHVLFNSRDTYSHLEFAYQSIICFIFASSCGAHPVTWDLITSLHMYFSILVAQTVTWLVRREFNYKGHAKAVSNLIILFSCADLVLQAINNTCVHPFARNWHLPFVNFAHQTYPVLFHTRDTESNMNFYLWLIMFFSILAAQAVTWIFFMLGLSCTFPSSPYRESHGICTPDVSCTFVSTRHRQ